MTLSNANGTMEKVITTGYLGAQVPSQILEPQQADAFINYLWDRQVLLGEARRFAMQSDTAEITRSAVGQRLVRRATEAVDDHVNVSAKFGKISLTTSKLRLDWELSTESLEDGTAGEALEDTIARQMAFQIGQDLEDLAINGDSATTDPLMSAFDGWRKGAGVALAAGAAGANGATRDAFNVAIKAFTRFYLQRRNELRFYVGSNVAADYQASLMAVDANGNMGYQREIMEGRGARGPEGGFGFLNLPTFGIPTREVPMLPENLNAAGTAVAADGADQYGTIELTFPQNRIWGVKREIKVYREFKVKKDTVEYTVFTRVGAAVEDPDAYVIVNGIKIL